MTDLLPVWLDGAFYGLRWLYAADVALTQRNRLNFGAGLTAVDNPGQARTDVTVDVESVAALVDTTGFSGMVRAPVRCVLTSLNAYTRVGNVITENANAVTAAQDGVTLVAGNRVLLSQIVSQDEKDNWIYDVTQVGTVAQPLILTRSSDSDSSGEVLRGMRVVATEGSEFKSSEWILSAAGAITLNTTELNVTENRLQPRPVRGALTSLAAYTRTGNTILADAVGAVGAQDGLTPAVGDRFYLSDLAAAAVEDKGLYRFISVGSAGTKFELRRTHDMYLDWQVRGGTQFLVLAGDVYLNTTWTKADDAPVVINVDELQFSPSLYTDAVNSQGTQLTLSCSPNLLAVHATYVELTSPIELKSYTKGALPAATTNRMIIVSDETGGLVPCFSDGTNWRRVTDRAIVS